MKPLLSMVFMMATFLGVLAILLWGALALLGAGTTDIPPFLLLFLCFSISTLLLVVKRATTKGRFLAAPTLSLPQWLLGVTGLFGFHYCYFMALKLAPAIEVSLIAYLWPMLLAMMVSSRADRLKSFVGGLLGFIGIGFIILSGESFSFNASYLAGYGLAACCAIIWSGYSWYFASADNKVDDIGFLSLVVALLALIAHVQLESSEWLFSTKQWLGIVLLGLGPVGGAFYSWDIGLKNGNKRLLASLSFLAPLISSVMLALAGLNAWSSNILTALGLILLGALVCNLSMTQVRAVLHRAVQGVSGTSVRKTNT